MMKKTYLEYIIAASITLSGAAFAEDFALKSNDDLFGMKDQVRTMDEGTRDAYRAERQNRMRTMDQSERDSRFSDMGASGKRNMDRISQNQRSRMRDGSGGGQRKGDDERKSRRNRTGRGDRGGLRSPPPRCVNP